MAKTPLPFDRLARRFLKGRRRAPGELVASAGLERPRIDVEGLAREVAQYDAEVRERLRLAALRAIDEELVKIRQERRRDDE